MPPPAQIPAIAPDGTPGFVDSARLQDAVNNNYRPGLVMRNSEGVKGIVAFTDMAQARANGYKTEGEYTQSSPTTAPNNDAGLVSSSMRFLKGAGSALTGAATGLYHTVTDAPQGTAETVASAIGPEGLIAYRMGLKPQIDTAKQAVTDLKAGNTTQGAAGLAASVIPFAGPSAASFGKQIGTQIGQGDYAGAAGNTAANIALALLTKKIGDGSIRSAALGDPDAAVLHGLQVGPKSPKALNIISAADNARPFLGEPQDLADLQNKISLAKAEIWKPYQQAINAIGNRAVQGPSGPTTVAELESERLQLSALNRGLRIGDPAALQLAQQKGMSAADLLDRENAVKAALDPELTSTGINPQLIRKIFGSVAQVESRVAGKTTLIEPSQPSGVGKIANISIKQPLQAPAQIASGVRDILAGRPIFSSKPTDLGIREGFRNPGPRPDLGSVQTTGVGPPPAALLNAPPTPLSTPAQPYQPSAPPNYYYNTAAMRLGRLLNAPPIELGGAVEPSPGPNFYRDTSPMRTGRILTAPSNPIQLNGAVEGTPSPTFRYDTTPMRQGRSLPAPYEDIPLSSHIDQFPNQRPGSARVRANSKLIDLIKKSESQ